jgi:hypothetical protein
MKESLHENAKRLHALVLSCFVMKKNKAGISAIYFDADSSRAEILELTKKLVEETKPAEPSR